MSSTTQEFQFSMTTIQNQDKVLYAKVSRDFVDVLLSFLTLPLGTIVRLLGREFGNDVPSFGSMRSLYSGLKDLDTQNFYWETGKRVLVKPRNSFEARCRKLKFKIDDTAPIRYFICQNWSCTRYPKYVSLYYDDMICYYCGKPIDLEVSVEDSNAETPSGGGVFVTSGAQSFIVADDLRILPDVPESVLKILHAYGVEDTNGLDEETVVFGFLEMMKLLKFSLVSKTPLTNTILGRRNMISAKVNQEPVSFVPHDMIKCNSKPSWSKKMSVTVFVQNSANRILSVQAMEDFVEFLFSLLTIPLGKAEFLLHGNACLGSVDNLYRSVSNLIGGEHISTPHHSINSLLNPLLPPNYVSENQILPLTQQSPHALLYKYNLSTGRHHLSMPTSRNMWDHEWRPTSMIDPKGLRPKAFMVTDDLVVTAACDFNLSMLQQTGIPLNDIDKYVLDVGMEEALNILKASLTSSFALTNGLKQCLNREHSEDEAFQVATARSVSKRQTLRQDIILALCVLAFSAFIFYAYSGEKTTE